MAIETHSCGGKFELVSESGTFVIYGTEIPVEHLFYRCTSCGEEQVTEDLAASVQAEAARIYRKRFNFLTGAEIRAIRERLGLTQEQMEGALAIGAKSLARWENDRVLQNRSVDDLLRLIDRDPSTLRFLAQVHGADLLQLGDLQATSLAIDATKWPRVLVAKLTAAAQKEKTDLNSYLIMFITQHLTESRLASFSKTLDDSVRALQTFTSNYQTPGYEEPWRAQHKEVMREAAAKDSYAV